MITSQPRPVMLIHDMWLHADALARWVGFLGARQRAAVTPGWPGEQATVSDTWDHTTSSGRLPAVGLVDLIDHFTEVARSFDRPPVIVGHGFGALVAEVLLARGEAWAVAAIEPAVLRGVQPLSWSQLVAGTLVMGAGIRRTQWTALDRRQFRLMFGTASTADSAAGLHRRWSIPAPVGPLVDAALGLVELTGELSAARVPRQRHLVVTGGGDRLAPRGTVRSNLGSTALHPSSLHRVGGRGHSLAVGEGWLEIAHVVTAWLEEIDPPSRPALVNASQLAVHQKTSALAHAS